MKRLALLALLLLPALAWGQKLTLPPTVAGEPGLPVVVKADTDCAALEWVVIDKGLVPIPQELLRDTKTAVVFGTTGSYRLMAIGAKADRPVFAICTVAIGKPTKPPVDPPVVLPPTGELYLMLVRPDGPASPEFTKIVEKPDWDTIRAAGHTVKDFTLSRARELGADIPAGSPLPCVIAIRNKKQVLWPDGKPQVFGLTPQSIIIGLPEAFK